MKHFWQIDEENELFKEGKASFYEKLNDFSDIPKEQFEKEMEGAILPDDKKGRGLGAILPPEDEWYTHPELEKFYEDRQTPPASYDATTMGIIEPHLIAFITESLRFLYLISHSK